METKIKRIIIKYIFCVIVLSFFTMCLNSIYAQNVSGVNFYQNDKNVVITYYLSEKSSVNLYVSLNGRGKYKKINKAIGDVGASIYPGFKRIIWSPLNEIGDVQSNNVIFKVSAKPIKEAKKKSTNSNFKGPDLNMPFLYYMGVTPDLSLGFFLGCAKKWGFFVNCKGGDKKLALNIGPMIHLFRNQYLYLGLGYGEIYYTISSQYSYEKTTHKAALSTNIGFNFNIPLGSLSKKYKLSALVGMNTLNFENYDLELGIGFTISF